MSTEANQPEQDLQQFIIQRLYIKNSSFETTKTPAIFQKKWEPELNLELNTDHTELEANTYEVTLTVTATVKNKEETAFLVEVQQAGVFTVNGPDSEQLNHILGSFCPSILFPYVRETVSSLVTKGSFPPLVLSPINFDALYMQKMQAQQEQKEDVQ
ncbi:MAG: protein-export chaperone SecB [Legionellaceae bacterium]|nr:protein-export chaperone SecB [Legionellaceae bacterium]MBP9774638.1 protein-export chaperone SecB [Legionellaceae bacterium]